MAFCRIVTSLIVLNLFCSFLPTSAESSQRGKVDYCENETLQARCGQDEVVVIVEAVYGIPSAGRCIDGMSHDQVGCHVNATEYLGGLCGGRRECNVKVPDKKLDGLTGCPASHTQYLTASYKCIKVSNGCRSCASSGYARLSTSVMSGFIPSVLTSESKEKGADVDHVCGSQRCPWMVHVQPGQIINLTLFDYSPLSDQQMRPTQPAPSQPTPAPGSQQQHARAVSGSTGSEQCHRIALIKERANPKDTAVCGGRQPKERHIYTSISNTLEVHVTIERTSQFLIYYEAIGCADVVPPKFSRMRRREDVVEIDCPADEQKWTLHCVGNKWDGEAALGKCTPEVHAVAPLNPLEKIISSAETTAATLVDSESNELSFSGFWNTLKSLPFSVLIALVIAVAIIIIVLIVTTGIFCIKKRIYDKKHKVPPNNDIYSQKCSEFEFRQDFDNGAAAYLVPKGIAMTLPAKKSRRSSEDDLLQKDNTYGAECHFESRPLPSLPRNLNDKSRRGSDFQNPTHPGNCMRPGYPPNGNYPTACYPSNNYYPNGYYPQGGTNPRTCNPNYQYAGYPTCNPNQFMGHPGYPPGTQFPNRAGCPPHGNYPPQGNFNYPPGQFCGNPNRVAVQMHRTDSGHLPLDQQPRRCAPPQGRAAVVYRGGGALDRSNAQSEENTYFVLDAEAVVNEPAPELADPMSLPRTQNRSMMSTARQPMPNGRCLVGSDYAETFETKPEPAPTTDDKYVEDVVLNPVELPGTNGKFFIAESPKHANNEMFPNQQQSNQPQQQQWQQQMTQQPQPHPQLQQSQKQPQQLWQQQTPQSQQQPHQPLPDDQPIFLGKGADLPTASDIYREATSGEENWPPPPPPDVSDEKETMLSSSASPYREGYQNNSLQITLRPSRDGQGQQRTVVAGGGNGDMSGGEGRIKSL